MEFAGQLEIYGNILLSDENKTLMAVQNLRSWVQYTGSSSFIRARGPKANLFAAQLAGDSRVQMEIDSRFDLWKTQTREDLLKSKAKFTLLFLEDHLIHPEAMPFDKVVDFLIAKDVDAFQYSWFFQYEKWRESNLMGIDESGSCYIAKVDKKLLKSLCEIEKRWIISMTCIFRREFLIKLLSSNKPWLKRTDPRAPFDMEKSPKSYFYLPLNFGLPCTGLGISLDDDNTINGSSALSRGLTEYTELKRVIRHHTPNSIYSILRRTYNSLLKSTIKNRIPFRLRDLAIRLALAPTHLLYSIHYVWLNQKDNYRMRKH